MAIIRNKQLGITHKNPGQFAGRPPHAEPDIPVLAGMISEEAQPTNKSTGIIQGSNRPAEKVLDVPEGNFDSADTASDWGRAATKRGAMRRYGFSEEEYQDALNLVNDNQGGWQKARNRFGLDNDQLRELTSTDRDGRDGRTPHFLNGPGTKRNWTILTASGLGRVPLVRAGEASSYIVPPPMGRNDTITVTEQGTLEFTDSDGNKRITDGAGIHRIFAERRGEEVRESKNQNTPEPVRVRVIRPTPPFVPRTPPYVPIKKRNWFPRLLRR